jgi:hypothetical protein
MTPKKFPLSNSFCLKKKTHVSKPKCLCDQMADEEENQTVFSPVVTLNPVSTDNGETGEHVIAEM